MPRRLVVIHEQSRNFPLSRVAMIRCLFLYYMICPLILFRCDLALPPEGGTFWQHLLYPLSHANLLHWALNGFSLLTLATRLTWGRTAWAYIFSVIAGYIYTPDLPLLGMSTIVYFYLGMLFIHLSSWRRWRIAIIVCAGLFIPGIAAVTHIMMLCFGIFSEAFRINGNRLK